MEVSESEEATGGGVFGKEKITFLSTINITVNGVQYEVGADNASPSMALLDYLREKLHLTGCKSVCREGGCSACTVVATAPDPENPGATSTFSVLACRQLLYACDGWSIETVEGLGDWRHGYHPIQTALAGFYGTQCGFCSPGMVMNMYGQLQRNESLTSSEAEKSLDGNLCRCTGYRPILDAFKSLTVDGDERLKDRLHDIEEAHKPCCLKGKGGCKGKSQRGSKCKAQCDGVDEGSGGGGGSGVDKGSGGGGGSGEKSPSTPAQHRVRVKAGNTQWYQPITLQEVCDILNTLSEGDAYQLVVGNTAQGVYVTMQPYTAYINTTRVPELYTVQEAEQSITLGANVSLKRAIEMLRYTADTVVTGFHHLRDVADHWAVVANESVRNVGCIAGNLMTKHQHPEFYSDIFLTLAGCDARVNVMTAATATTTTVTLEEFLALDMSRSIITSLVIPTVSENTRLRCYKITPRAVNAHAYVNAVFRLEVDPNDTFTITSRPTILYGGINPQFVHASKTEDFLTGRSLSEPDLVVRACEVLKTEVFPDSQPEDASPQYRASLTQSLLFKAIISIQSDLGYTVSPSLVSAGSTIQRPLSSGQQTFNTDQTTWPLGQPIPKVEALTQVAGEADFMNDVASLPDELTGVFIQSSVGRANITSIDTSQAMGVEGVVAVLTAADIPGMNNVMAEGGVHVEEVFAASSVVYAGQALGLVVATSASAAYRGAAAVLVQYDSIQTPTLTIQQAITDGSYSLEIDPVVMGDVEDAFTNSEHVLSAEVDIGYQNHFCMELMGARVTPIDDGYDVIATTIWPAEAQRVVAQVLGIDANSVNVSVRRIGGSFGQKINRCHPVVAAAAVAAWHTHSPVRVVLNLNTYMTMLGGRDPYHSKYKVGFDSTGKVGFDSTGKVNGLEIDVYCDAGCIGNDSSVTLATSFLTNVYSVSHWLMRPWTVITNTPSNTYMRAPGIVQGIIVMETLMDHVANTLGVDPLSVREVNLATTGAPRPQLQPFGRNVFAEDILPLLKTSAAWDQRQQEVADFNDSNRWRKRGLALMPMCFNIGYGGFRFGVVVNLYTHDGTVAISHGGIEMGQGLNTKVSQVAAYILGVPLESVKVKATSTTTNANSSHQGASVCSDVVCKGVEMACEQLMERITEFKEKRRQDGKAETSWPELIRMCRDADIDVSQRLWTRLEHLNKNYDVYGGAVMEAEIDVLTGQTQIRRADIIEDCGQSLSPYVDIGQVEGALVQGLGLVLTEKVKFNSNTGQKLSNGTWEYKVMSALDIPVDLRVTLLPNSYNDSGVLRAKAVGEPPLVMAYCAAMAVRKAITAALTHTQQHTTWFQIDMPVTVESVQQLCKVESSQFTIK
ncbi:hypothetical protein Pcinc_020543 [Petrolisthes cinctipes]|uniref:Aldehyde oxidase n=1 Tax=Petrolisthes cinctipes TaxID=88211 RepID=A0AAE1KIY9_PETCI|nr:hypothetical protein Pcinc_020543 [Petrolisthes cinctipes]KAK3874525.1 hypothetical protein Pcinc_020543 [Petrolisthes cinctipes]